MKAQAKQVARNLLGEIRSEASRRYAQDPSIDEEIYFIELAKEFLHSFALEATNIVGIPNGLDVFRGVASKGKNNESNSRRELGEGQAKELN